MTRTVRPVRSLLPLAVLASCLSVAALAHAGPPSKPLRVGSKRFVESFVLAEITAAIAREEGISTTHELGLGGTAVVFRALEDGAIDVYPEYTGTLAETIVKDASGAAADAGSRTDLKRLREALGPRGISISDPMGFEDKYAIAVRRDIARRDGLRTLSDFARHPELRTALSHEFAGRTDGWPGLVKTYGIGGAPPSVMDHGLAYEAIARSRVDAIDVYTTDAKIPRYDLVVLEDDRRFFPPYEAVLVYRNDVPSRFPRFDAVLERMRGILDDGTMQTLNARADIDGVPFDRVAADFLAGRSETSSPAGSASRAGTSGSSGATKRSLARGVWNSILRHGPRHVWLVAVSLLFSTMLGIPLGVLAFARRRTGVVVLGITGIVQTIPSLALFCFFIPLVGIGAAPALLALFLYGLLPIVRNTHAGLSSIPDDLREAGLALGLSPFERLRHVELPLASRTILAGLKTSAIVGVGSATIAAFIGAGGFGEPISTGLSLNDVPTILEGAIPAAGLALVTQALFAVLDRLVVPKGLRNGDV